MAMEYLFDGPCLIKVDTGTSNALEDLGYTADGVRLEERKFHGNVPTDLNGGPEGPPGDVQYFGELHIVQFTLTKFDDAILSKVAPGVYGGTYGTLPNSGTFMSSNAFRLLLYPDDYASGSNNPRNYPIAFPRGSISFNKGTKFRGVQMSWECHQNSSTGVIFNTTDT
jgi:hypothetical protein